MGFFLYITPLISREGLGPKAMPCVRVLTLNTEHEVG